MGNRELAQGGQGRDRRGQAECDVHASHVCAHERSELRTRQLLRFSQQVASGLSFLHTHTVVHRDVKGSNVLLDGAQLVAKISDFGLSHVLSHQMGESACKTFSSCGSYRCAHSLTLSLTLCLTE